MNPKTSVRAVALGALLVWAPAAVSGQPGSAPNENRAAEAAKLLKEATARVKKSDWAGAYPRLKKSFELVPASETAANLGQAAHALGKFAEACRYLAYALRTLSPTVPVATRQGVESLQVATRKEVTEVRLSVEPPNAEVFVDDEARGRAADLFDPIFLDPGSHRVEARADGYVTKTESVTAEKGTQRDIALKLERTPGASGAAGASSAGHDGGAGPTASSSRPERDAGVPPVTPPSDPRVTIGIVGGGLTAIAIGAGVVFSLQASSAGNDEDELSRGIRTKYGPNACSSPTGAAAGLCAEYFDKVDERKGANRWSTVSFVAAGGLAVATVAAVLLWPRNEAPAVSAWGSRDGGGVLVGGAF